MEESLLSQGVELMLAGIGSVFVFLVLLVVATRAMSWAIVRFVNDESASLDGASDSVSGMHVAAITAAVNRYRTEKS